MEAKEMKQVLEELKLDVQTRFDAAQKLETDSNQAANTALQIQLRCQGEDIMLGKIRKALKLD